MHSLVGPDEAFQIQTQEVLHDSTDYTAIRVRIQTIDFPYSDTFLIDQMWVRARVLGLLILGRRFPSFFIGRKSISFFLFQLGNGKIGWTISICENLIWLGLDQQAVYDRNFYWKWHKEKCWQNGIKSASSVWLISHFKSHNETLIVISEVSTVTRPYQTVRRFLTLVQSAVLTQHRNKL